MVSSCNSRNVIGNLSPNRVGKHETSLYESDSAVSVSKLATNSDHTVLRCCSRSLAP